MVILPRKCIIKKVRSTTKETSYGKLDLIGKPFSKQRDQSIYAIVIDLSDKKLLTRIKARFFFKKEEWYSYHTYLLGLFHTDQRCIF
jgi:hypothetical protein